MAGNDGSDGVTSLRWRLECVGSDQKTIGGQQRGGEEGLRPRPTGRGDSRGREKCLGTPVLA